MGKPDDDDTIDWGQIKSPGSGITTGAACYDEGGGAQRQVQDSNSSKGGQGAYEVKDNAIVQASQAPVVDGRGLPAQYSNGNIPYYRGETPEGQKTLWQARIVRLAHEILKADPEYHKGHLQFDDIASPLQAEIFAAIHSHSSMYAVYEPLPWMGEDEQWAGIRLAVEAAWEDFKAKNRNELILVNGVKPERASSIVVEDAIQAKASNAEYLSRPAIIGRLYYTHHASVHVGGKHEGKTTMTKTEGLAVATGGIKLYGREVMQTPVIYAASEDEYPSVRMDLLRMGWDETIPLHMVKISNNGDRDYVLEDIAKEALKRSAYFVILDMLFDFTQVEDEIAYAETREKMGKVIDLAVAINGHVKATHHAPKWFPTAEAASKAVLGSQGVVARFSPVLLSRMWVAPTDDDPGLFTVESTMTRDPRGLAIPATVVKRNMWGWTVAEDPFDSSMKWPIYKQRIIDLIKMSEPSKRWTVHAISQELGIARPDAQNALSHMCQGDNAVLERMKKMGQGGGYTYALLGVNTLDLQ